MKEKEKEKGILSETKILKVKNNSECTKKNKAAPSGSCFYSLIRTLSLFVQPPKAPHSPQSSSPL